MIERYNNEPTIGSVFVEPTKKFFKEHYRHMNVLTGIFFGLAGYSYLNHDQWGLVAFFNLGAIANYIALESKSNSEDKPSSSLS